MELINTVGISNKKKHNLNIFNTFCPSPDLDLLHHKKNIYRSTALNRCSSDSDFVYLFCDEEKIIVECQNHLSYMYNFHRSTALKRSLSEPNFYAKAGIDDESGRHYFQSQEVSSYLTCQRIKEILLPGNHTKYDLIKELCHLTYFTEEKNFKGCLRAIFDCGRANVEFDDEEQKYIGQALCDNLHQIFILC